MRIDKIRKAEAIRKNGSTSTPPHQIWVILSTRMEGGGAEVQARWEWEMLRRHGIPAFLLTFDPALKNKEDLSPCHGNIRGPAAVSARRLYENVTSISLAKRAEHAIRDAVQKIQTEQRSSGSFSSEPSYPEISSPETPSPETPSLETSSYRSSSVNSSPPPQLILHLHNVTRAYSSICLAVRNIRRSWPDCMILETIHDCRVICDKGARVLPDGSPCHETSAAGCLRCCFLKTGSRNRSLASRFPSLLYGLYRLRIQRRNQRIRNNTADLLICPSKDLTELLQVSGYPRTIHIPNMVPCDIHAIHRSGMKNVSDSGKGETGPYDPKCSAHQNNLDQQNQNDKSNGKRILFCAGAIREGKGIPFLLSVFRQQDYQHLELHIAGKIEKGDPEEENTEEEKSEKEKESCKPMGNLENLLQTGGAVYEGSLCHEMLIQRLHTAYAVIIPSVSYENYPNIGLEAAAAGCLVCGSRNGGIQEEVFSRALLYERNSRENLKRVLHVLDTMEEKTYRQLLKRQLISLAENNTWPVWYARIQCEISRAEVENGRNTGGKKKEQWKERKRKTVTKSRKSNGQREKET